jgi:hypothetical protein
VSGDLIGRRRLELASADIVVHLALGLLSATRRVEAIAGRYAGPGDSGLERAEHAESALDLVLGLIAFGEKLRATLTAASAAPIAAVAHDHLGDVSCR